jgi:hypothetical protein
MKWISIKDRMPKDYQRVLATDGKGYDFLHLSNEFGFMEQPTGVKFWCPDNIHCSPKVNVNKITHWMEVELPKKKESVMKFATKAHKLGVKVSRYKTGNEK